MIRKFSHAFHVAGTLSGNLNIRFTAPTNCTLQHVSAVGSNATDATMTIGTSADTDGFLKECAIGKSNTPAEKEIADFDGDLLTDAGKEPPRISDGTIVVVVLDYDGDGGTACDDFTLVLTFAEG